jgi:hypothetical protein
MATAYRKAAPFAGLSRAWRWLSARSPLGWIAIGIAAFMLLSLMTAIVLTLVLVGSGIYLVSRARAARSVPPPTARPVPETLVGIERYDVFAGRAQPGAAGEFDAFLEARARAARDVSPRPGAND